MTARLNLSDAQAPARPRVAMALYGDLTHDSRVIGEADTLAAHGRAVRVYSLARTPPAGSNPRRRTPAADDPVRLRAALHLAPDDPIALYHGGFIPGRGIELLAEALLEPGVERVHAALLGFGPLRDELEALAADERFGGRLHVMDAVPPDELLGWVSGADVVAIPVQPSTFNYRIGLPNKLWEALAAGVPVVVSDLPELRRVVLEDPQRPLGATCDPTSSASIAAAVRAIVERPADERAALRQRCLDAAHRRWNWDTESEGLLALYRQLMPVVSREGDQ